MKRLLLWLWVPLLLGCVAVPLWLLRDRSEPPVQASVVVVRASANGPVAPVATPAAEAAATGFMIDASGHLKINADTRRAIAGLLGPDNSLLRDADIARAEATIKTQLREPAVVEALHLLDDVVAYRRAAAEWSTRKPTASVSGSGDLSAIADMQHRAVLRDKYLGATTSQALFSEQDAMARYQLARQQIMQMNGLSAEQKDEQLAILFQQLPLSAQMQLKGTEMAAATQ